MTAWNGMTEPLGVGDRVRIVAASSAIGAALIGTITAVVMVYSPGFIGELAGYPGKIGTVQGGGEGYVLDNPPHCFPRHYLWKLPPDHDHITDEERINEKTKQPKSRDKGTARQPHAA